MPLENGGLPVVFDHHVLRHRKAQHQPALVAVLMDGADAVVEHVARRRVLNFGAVDHDPAPVAAGQAGDRLDELLLAVAVDAGNAEDLALVHVQGEARAAFRCRGCP